MEIIRKTCRNCPVCEKRVGFFDKSSTVETSYEDVVKGIRVKVVTANKYHKECLVKSVEDKQNGKKDDKVDDLPPTGTLPKGYSYRRRV